MFPSAHAIPLELRLKRGLNLGGRATENYGAMRGWNLFHFHAQRAQPLRDLSQIVLRYAKAPPELFGGQPAMVVARCRILLRPQKFVERCFLRSIGSEHQDHASHIKVRSDAADRKFRPRQRVSLAGQHNPLLIEDWCRDPVRRPDR